MKTVDINEICVITGSTEGTADHISDTARHIGNRVTPQETTAAGVTALTETVNKEDDVHHGTNALN